MGKEYLSPGVGYFEQEILPTRSGSDVFAVGIVGGATKGPLELTSINSKNQLYDIFGYPTTDDYGIYAAEEVLENTNQIYYKRIVDNAAAYGTTTVGTHGTVTSTVTIADDAALAALTNTEKTKILTFTVDGVAKNYTVTEVVTTKADFLVALNTALGGAATASFDTNKLKVTSATTGSTSTVTASGTASAAIMGASPVAVSGTDDSAPFVFTTKSFDSTLNGCTVKVEIGDDDVVTVTLSKGTVVLEKLSGFTVTSGVLNYLATAYGNKSSYLTCVRTSATLEGYTGGTYTIAGGNNGIAGLTAADVVGVDNSGLKAFYSADTVDVYTLIAPGWSDPEVIEELNNITIARGDCMAIVDVPQGLTPALAKEWVDGTGTYSGTNDKLDNEFLAVYFPWVYKLDRRTGANVLLPNSCFVASQYAFNDAKANPWYAPAGLDNDRGVLKRAVNVQYELTKEERDLLYGEASVINPIVIFKDKGVVLFGNKTTRRGGINDANSAKSSINVRRLCNYIKKFVISISLTELFNPNDRFTWNSWKLKIEPRLRAIKEGRGLEAYKIVMDETTVTPEAIADGSMPGTIYIKPIRAAEWIPITFVVTSDDVIFTE